MVTEEDLEQGRMYPPLQDIRKCSVKIATYIAEHAYRIGKYPLCRISGSVQEQSTPTE